MSSTQEKLEKMLRVMYVTAIQDADGTRAGRKDYRLRYDEVPEAYAREIMQLIDSAKREAKIEMLKNMKKSLMVARVNPGLKPLQLPEDARIQQMIADEFDRNIAQLEQSEESI